MSFYNGQGKVISVAEENISGRPYYSVVYINIQGWQQIHLIDQNTGQIVR
ncbi:MAG: PepSY domain-containing protein [Acidiferrobacterales bacterium]|nr:PepSY domain-containing protein [Acidiferrobacterales bacterium]